MGSRKAAGLDPGVWELGKPVLAEKQQPSGSWDLTPLMFGGDTKGAPCLAGHLSVRREQLGSSSEVDGFRLRVRNRLLVRTWFSSSSGSTLRSAVPRPFDWSSRRG